ncbi:AMP-binding protein [Pseudonocardia sp. RS11V-5]|uniref:AMP-binding protein n=1 Tax=Pseudonocardia terrae TaxID=2905831 RepID=UPI001E65A2D6|nr:AMP-binding protein [Pseudonocardia terrae]MCE3552434.1 AMP-binding protein [Pseudonocardia terrae]
MSDRRTPSLTDALGPAAAGLRGAATTALGTGRALVALTRSGVVRPMRPDRLAGSIAGLVRYRLSLAGGYAVGAARHPDRPAVVDESGTLTYAEVHARTDGLARALKDRGAAERTRVGVLCRNHHGAIEAMVACAKLGADVVLLNTGLPAGQLAEIAGELRLRLVVTDEEFRDRIPEGLTVIGEGELDALTATPGPPPGRPAEEGRVIVLTSGTTGTPKGAQRPPISTIAPAASILSVIPLRAGEPTLLAAPLFHTWGNAGLLLTLLHGGTVVLRRRFDPEDFLDAVAAERIQVVIAVPVMVQRVFETGQPWRDGHRPRIIAVSGSALPTGLAQDFMDRYGDCLYNLYGSTEVSWVSIASPRDLREAPGTAGRAPVGTVLRILDDDGRGVPPNTDGRVFVGNDLPFEGYTREGQDIERQDGLIGTGDVGHLDDAGRLFLTGRGDDMIVSGGENVHPGPVEDLIAADDAVREVAVVGVPDEKFGQRLAAYVVLREGASLDEDGVRALVKEKAARFAVPRDVVFLDELPRNQTGKVVTRELPGVD